MDDSTLQVPPTAERFQFIVTSTAYATTSFTVTANGQDLVIPVQVVPQSTLEATLSNAAPALGEVMTVTAPAGTHFSATSAVTVPGLFQPVVTILAADARLDVLLPPNLDNATLTIWDVATVRAGLAVHPTTSATVTTPVLTNFVGTLSDLAPDANEAVTLTLAGATFDPATAAVQAGSDVHGDQFRRPLP